MRNICGVQARFIAARKKCRSRARSYWLVIDNGHASILATMAAVVASLMTVEINGRISGACWLIITCKQKLPMEIKKEYIFVMQ